MKRSTSTNTAKPRSAIPPLPSDLMRQLLARLRSSKPARKRHAIDACLASRAFALGFVCGADPERARRRHVVGPHHEHWLRGYDAGQRAAEHATTGYLRDQLLLPHATPNATSLAPRVAAPRPRTERAPAIHAARTQPSAQLTLL
jgi:hypothetical protein